MTRGVYWVVWTERAKEAPRTGFGPEALRATLVHLRDRGDRTARMQSEPNASIVTVDLHAADTVVG